MYDRDIFFANVRASLFGGAMTQQQVDGMGALLALWEGGDTGTPMDDPRWLAYSYATVFHECAKTMWPIEEYGKGSGQSYGKKDPETGQTYYGRGLIMITWRENYANASKKLALVDDRDLEWHAGMALDFLISSRVLFRGMAEGWFRSDSKGRHTLGRYFGEDVNGKQVDDPVGARNIVNGDVSKNGSMIAGYHKKFLTALDDAVIPDASKTPVILNVQAPPGAGVVIHLNGEELTA